MNNVYQHDRQIDQYDIANKHIISDNVFYVGEEKSFIGFGTAFK